MRKHNLILMIGLSFILAAFLVGVSVPALADPVYDLQGGNALIRGELKAKRVKPWVKTIDSYEDFDTASGSYSFEADLSQWSEYHVDLSAIYDSTLPWTASGLTTWAQALSGVTVEAMDVVGNYAEARWAVMCTGVDTSGATPVYVWKPDNGTLRGLGASSEWITGASVWAIDDDGDRIDFQNGEVGGGVSVYEIDRQIGS